MVWEAQCPRRGAEAGQGQMKHFFSFAARPAQRRAGPCCSTVPWSPLRSALGAHSQSSRAKHPAEFAPSNLIEHTLAPAVGPDPPGTPILQPYPSLQLPPQVAPTLPRGAAGHPMPPSSPSHLPKPFLGGAGTLPSCLAPAHSSNTDGRRQGVGGDSMVPPRCTHRAAVLRHPAAHHEGLQRHTAPCLQHREGDVASRKGWGPSFSFWGVPMVVTWPCHPKCPR